MRPAAAHALVFRARREGSLAPQPCEVCGGEPAVAHHDDYDKPLDVRWLCYAHHRQLHIAQRTVRLEAGSLRRAREKEGRSRESVARILEVSMKTIERWESGESPIPTHRLSQLAAIYRVRVASLNGNKP